MDSEETTGIIIGSLVAWFCLLCCMTMCLVLYSSVCFSLVLALPVLGSLPCASCIPLARSTLNRIRHAQNQDEPTSASSTGIIIHSLVAGSSPTTQFRSSSAAPNDPELGTVEKPIPSTANEPVQDETETPESDTMQPGL